VKNGSVTAPAKKGKPAANSSSSDSSDDSSDEEDVSNVFQDMSTS